MVKITRRAGFEELPGRTAWLGASPTDKRIRAEFERPDKDGGLPFYVINGAWPGKLYQEPEEGSLYIIDGRGERHDPVYIVEFVEQRTANVRERDADGVPF